MTAMSAITRDPGDLSGSLYRPMETVLGFLSHYKDKI
jgi:hypothetical protein